MNGRLYLTYKGHTYCKTSEYDGKTYWRCQSYYRFGCKARIISKHVNGWEMMKIKCGIHMHVNLPKKKNPSKPKPIPESQNLVPEVEIKTEQAADIEFITLD